MTQFIEFLEKHGKVVAIVCCCLLVVIASLSMMIDNHHAHTWVEHHVPAFWSIFGFLATTAIILIARVCKQAGLQVDNDFYERSLGAVNSEEKK